MQLLVNGAAAEVSIDSEGLRWVPCDADVATGESTQSLFACLSFLQSLATPGDKLPFAEMIAAQRSEEAPLPAFWTPSQKLFGVSIYTLRRSPAKASEWHPSRLLLESPNEELIQQLHLELTTGIAGASSTRPRRLLVILNPNAGSGAARTHYRAVVHPIFSRAEIATKIIETKRAGHAAEIVREALVPQLAQSSGNSTTNDETSPPRHSSEIRDRESNDWMLQYDGIIAVGGDGIFHEILNGLMEARAAAVVGARGVLARLRLAHIPCGSTDAVACSLNGCRSVFTSAMHVALGDSTPLDVLRVSIGGTVRYACCIATYGFMGDVVQESERHRWLGPLRYDLVGALKLLGNQSYKCRVRYRPPSDEEESANFDEDLSRQSSTSAGTVCVAHCPVCRAASSRSLSDLHSLEYNESTVLGEESSTRGSTKVSMSGRVSSAGVTAGSTSGSGTSLSSGDWRVIEGEWMSIMLIVQPCRSDKTPYGMARHGHLANGRFTLVLVKKCSPVDYLRFLLTMSSSGLTPGQLPGVIEVLDAVSCRVESMGGPVSHWNVDGELVEGVDMEAHAHLGAVQCFARGVES